MIRLLISGLVATAAWIGLMLVLTDAGWYIRGYFTHYWFTQIFLLVITALPVAVPDSRLSYWKYILPVVVTAPIPIVGFYEYSPPSIRNSDFLLPSLITILLYMSWVILLLRARDNKTVKV